ncbi:glycoside hydrolase family 2 TIM barrel-domain containing protein [Herbiconiux flava]|uniref:Beta-galactosidase/beta-glucuronidase n=1 Tax=Herbiconiux flava TaxID=881268 RepID=A0A852SNZ0_9MICO|nr:glycoside hydrolase family 2 TIM barrel-domain containing protein [Herbiconiux flava]NYD70539.1 beta-galactosidase/beta-glucuronidase [Herbiconiux flava]GLK17292.1 beta-galactosidase [Herbiconiux flava]
MTMTSTPAARAASDADLPARGLPDATTQDGTYPRPQLMRPHWHDLSGTWDFAWDDDEEYEHDDVPFSRRIEVPFPPESPASGIHETGFHSRAWYRRTVGAAELRAAGAPTDAGAAPGRMLLHFGAVDHAASVWVNGHLVATHVGGQTPFAADITRLVRAEGDELTIVVRAVDLPGDVSSLRGKQDWREEPHTIWYHRTTGIWQPVWLEWVPSVSVESIIWRSDLTTSTVEADIELSGPVAAADSVSVTLSHLGETIAATTVSTMGEGTVSVRLVIPRQLNGQQYEELLWSPSSPTLIGARISVHPHEPAAPSWDTVSSYLGLRSVATSDDALLLNDRPIYLRSVLAQNYWPESHLAASAATLKREVELILELGFNAARVHQKVEDPRFLYWADRLGLMLWGETASAYAFDPKAVGALVSEWTAVLERDRSHPSIIAWVPLNESWGVQHISHDPRQRAFSRAIADLTRALDGTRPVISNDGWEHTDSDIMTIHDYEADPATLTSRYGSAESLQRMIDGFGPAGRRMSAEPGPGASSEGRDAHPHRPIMLTEFGGVSLETGGDGDWGYSTARDAESFEKQVTSILLAVGSVQPLAGFCYTQLTDTGQETNGLLHADRSPKFPVDRIRAAVRG